MKNLPLVFFASLLIGFQANAAILFAPSVTFMQQSLKDNALPEAENKLTVIDVRLGYVTDFGLYLGGLYSLHDHNNLADSSDSYFGPSVGYYNSGFFIAGTYFLYGERDLTNGAGKYAGVSGYQVDVAYTVPVTESLRIGPQLTYHSIKFDELLAPGGIGTPSDYALTGLVPAFNFMFVF